MVDAEITPDFRLAEHIPPKPKPYTLQFQSRVPCIRALRLLHRQNWGAAGDVFVIEISQVSYHPPYCCLGVLINDYLQVPKVPKSSPVCPGAVTGDVAPSEATQSHGEKRTLAAGTEKRERRFRV